MSLIESAFIHMSDKTLLIKEKIEQMLDCNVYYNDMPSESYNHGDSGFDYQKGYYSVRVKTKNRDGSIISIEKVEEVFTHEILHARQYALGFPMVCANNMEISNISQRLGRNGEPHPLVGIRNLSSVIGHIELLPIMIQLGYSIDNHLGKNLRCALDSKDAMLQAINSKGKISKYDYEILCADLLLQLIELYLFYPCDIKKQLEDIHPFLEEKLKLISRKLNVGVVRDIVTENLQFTEFIDIDKCDNNCTRLINFTDLSGKGLFKIRYKDSLRTL